jgi:spore coat protein CotH
MKRSVNRPLCPIRFLTVFACVTLLVLPSIARTQDFYDIETINTVELYFDEPNWDEILDSLYLVGEDARLLGTAVINGEQFDSVGVRYKGNSSYSPNQVKNPLNIKLDWVIDDQTLDGYGTLKLSNCFKDPSFVREVISYEIARNYMPAGLANYANVSINDTLIGLYVSVQDVDRLFMRTHFYSDENPRFKGILSSPMIQSPVWGYLGPDSTNYFDYYKMESDYGWGELVDFLDTLNNHTEEVEEVLDVDNHLWMLAFDILMVNLDSPINMAQNYYLYRDDSRQFNPIPWDLNENFGGFSSIAGGPPLSVQQMQQLDPFFNSGNPNYPIINRFLADPVYQKRYVAHLKTLMEEVFADGWFLNRVLEIQSLIDAAVQADSNKFYPYEEFLNNVYTSVGFGPMSIVGLTELMDVRISFLQNHPALQGDAPIISDVWHSPFSAPPNSTVWVNAAVANADIVQLGYRQSLTGRFYPAEMFDDGNHNDGLPDDGVYGASLNVESTDVDYYVYAENTEAAAFSPERAEYDYFTVYVSGALAINEFMADNETTIADPQGDYDDWIEIYNGSGEAQNLLGLYLTDDLSNPDKWAFPDTTMDAGGFLLVWADEDGGDPGLHANFKLNREGEEIGLYRDNAGHLELLDYVIFGSQAEDTSYGRYPDGADNWSQLFPTPGEPNLPLGGSDLIIELTYVSGSPVPASGGNVYFDVYVENADTSALDFDAWLDISYEGGDPTTVVLRSFTDYQPGWSINRPNTWFPVPGSYAAGNYTLTGKVGIHPDDIWNESGFPFTKSGDAASGGFTCWIPAGVPDPFEELDEGDAGEASLPDDFTLFDPYPNPFNPTTVIRFQLPEAARVALEVFDVNGRLVPLGQWTPTTEYFSAGTHEITFDGSGLPSGVYIYRLTAGNYESAGKMVLLK